MITEKKQRLVIKILCVTGLLSLFSLTMTTFTWGVGDYTIHFLILYPILFITTILVFANLTIAYYLTVFIAFSYLLLLNRDFGDLVIFKSHNAILYFVLGLPYFTMLFLILTVTVYLSREIRYRKVVFLTATLITATFPIYAVADRYNMNYSDSVFAEYKIHENGMVEITCKPQPSDTRQFLLTSNSQELATVAKQQGTFLIDYYYANTGVKKNYQFKEFRSLTITRVKDIKLEKPLTWNADDIEGDVSFLSP